MSSIQAFVKRHPVFTYFALTFTISWGGILILVVPFGVDVLAGSFAKDQVDMLMALVLLAWFAGPSGASILLTGLGYGRTGLRELLSRLLTWRVGVRWYAAALLPAPFLVTIVLLALSLRSPEFLPGIFTSDEKLALLLFGIAWGLIGGGFLEELGWTGFAVPRLRLRYSAVTTGLIVGTMWGALHFILIFWGSDSMSGANALAVYLLGILFFYLGALPAYRVLMVWVYDRTASLLVAMLMHASLSASTYIFAPPATGVAYMTWNFVLAAVLWAVVAGVALANRWHLPRQRLRRQVA